MAGAVTVYNACGTEVLQHVSPKHARKMIHRGVARVKQAAEDGRLAALSLLKYIFPKWKYSERVKHYSKRGVLARDGHTCGYCGKQAKTIDHIVPRCQSGESTWLNTVASCLDCNSRKGGRTPEQAGMVLNIKPYTP